MSEEAPSNGKTPAFTGIVDQLYEFSDKAENYPDAIGQAGVHPCACGCGQSTKGGTFLPGHDAKLRAAIEESVGGLLALEGFLEAARQFVAGRLSAEEYQRRTKEIIGNRT